MSTVIDPYVELDSAIDSESWDWLCENLPGIAAGVSVALQKQQTPADIRRRVVARTQRSELGLRVYQAACHLVRVGTN